MQTWPTLYFNFSFHFKVILWHKNFLNNVHLNKYNLLRDISKVNTFLMVGPLLLAGFIILTPL